MGKIYIGTSGYNYHHWKNVFYPVGTPQREWLLYYSQHFNSIEINATFYRDFEAKVFAKWYATTDNNFSFAIKGPRLITHLKRLVNVEDNLKNFINHALHLQKKLSCVLWQYPASFVNSANNFHKLKNFLLILPSDAKNVFEFRHESWFSGKVYDLLNKYNAGLVINNSLYFPQQEIITGNLVYIRFHGPQELYASEYRVKELENWANKILIWQKKYDIFCYFNNDMGGYAVKNALELKKLTEG